jgi:glyoxylase-like metal-dependent hydrolase (beta-lactamase superfamily II)
MEIIKIRLPWSNVHLILGDRSVLVDSGSAGDLVRIVAALRAHGADPKDLAAIVQTHGHADHAGCAASLRDLSDAPDRDDVNSFFEPVDYNALIYKFTHTASAPFAAANATSVLSVTGELPAGGGGDRALRINGNIDREDRLTLTLSRLLNDMSNLTVPGDSGNYTPYNSR